MLLVLSIYQGAGTTRADDHTAGFSVCAIVLRDEHLWHERERDQRLAVSDVGAGCCVLCYQHVYSRDCFLLKMKPDLRVGCFRTVSWMTSRPGFRVHEGSALKGDRRVSHSGIAIISVWKLRTMVTLVSSHTALAALSPTTQYFPASRIQHRLGRKHFVQLMHGVGDLVALVKMPMIFERSLFSAWWLDLLVSPVESLIDRTASRNLGEAHGNT